MTDERPAATRTPDDALSWVDEAADRAGGAPPSFGADTIDGAGSDRVDHARRHLDEAWTFSAAGTAIPADARMRQVKRAIMLALRPVTSHQVPFNQEISVAVKELAAAVDHLAGRTEGADRRVDAATTRVEAGLATAEVTLDDLTDSARRVKQQVEDLTVRIARLEQLVASERGENRALRARQDLLLRTTRDALGGKAQRRRLAALSSELDDSAELLSEDLADITRGTRDDVRAEVAGLADDVLAVAGTSPVVDLGAGRGEWLEVLRERGIDAYGVDTSERAVAEAARRDLDVRHEEATAHLAELSESSVGVITAFHLVERLGTEALLKLLDRALLALRPGGLLMVSAANPTALDVGAAEVWLDPARRRPVHPDLLELLTLTRGFAEAEVRWLQPVDPALRIQPDDLPGVDAGRVEGLVDRLNRILAGPRSYAVVARKPGGSPHASP